LTRWCTSLSKASFSSSEACNCSSARLPPGDVLFEGRSGSVLLRDVHPRPDVLELARFIPHGPVPQPGTYLTEPSGISKRCSKSTPVPSRKGAIEGLLHEGAGSSG